LFRSTVILDHQPFGLKIGVVIDLIFNQLSKTDHYIQYLYNKMTNPSKQVHNNRSIINNNMIRIISILVLIGSILN